MESSYIPRVPEGRETLQPTFQEVAVPVPHFKDNGRTYSHEEHVRGFLLQTGVVDERTIQEDPRFGYAQNPRIILYAATGTNILRFDMDTRRVTDMNVHDVKTPQGIYAPGSLHLQKGGITVHSFA